MYKMYNAHPISSIVCLESLQSVTTTSQPLGQVHVVTAAVKLLLLLHEKVGLVVAEPFGATLLCLLSKLLVALQIRLLSRLHVGKISLPRGMEVCCVPLHGS